MIAVLVRIAQVSKLTVTLVPLRDEEDQEEDCITDVLEEKMLEALQAVTPNSVRAQWQLAKWTYEEPRSVANMVSSEELAATRTRHGNASMGFQKAMGASMAQPGPC